MNQYKDAHSRPRFIKSNDPSVYGYICPRCNKRYGEAQMGGYIDVVRCSKCPPLAKTQQWENIRRRSKGAQWSL